jgi:3-oxoacyl-[acyl-carrier-protein] synthase III
VENGEVNRRMIKAIMKEIGIDSGSLEQELLQIGYFSKSSIFIR